MKTEKNESFPGGEIKAALSLAGLAKKAGRIVTGTDKVCDDIRGAGKIRLVAVADDISANTDKRLSDCCSWNGVQLEKCAFSSEQLGAALGRESGIACAGFTDEGFEGISCAARRTRVKPKGLKFMEEAKEAEEFDSENKPESVLPTHAGAKTGEKEQNAEKQHRFEKSAALSRAA